MKILTFLIIASALIVYEAQPSRLSKRDQGQTSGICATCLNVNMWEIKCGVGYSSDNVNGCGLNYQCKVEDASGGSGGTPTTFPEPDPYTCETCPSVSVWEIKCSKIYDSEHAKGCALFFGCHQEGDSGSTPSPGGQVPAPSYPTPSYPQPTPDSIIPPLGILPSGTAQVGVNI